MPHPRQGGLDLFQFAVQACAQGVPPAPVGVVPDGTSGGESAGYGSRGESQRASTLMLRPCSIPGSRLRLRRAPACLSRGTLEKAVSLCSSVIWLRVLTVTLREDCGRPALSISGRRTCRPMCCCFSARPYGSHRLCGIAVRGSRRLRMR
jgi:hypothetical protein